MDLSPKRFADTVVLAPTGRIDHGRSEDLKTALRPHLERCTAANDRLVLDLSGVDYISSAGLRVLMLARKQAKAQAGTLVVAGLGPVVKEIFEISRFTVVFEIFATVREALGRVSPTALAAFDAA
ncbi:MAG TPA: STAS domain-containing protein [Candidatus Methylomirabilis sp.]|nr:STAS domain-containing protein [Candidatus Methylomirabilis sp.]